MIEYCLLIFLNCKTHACINELQRKHKIYETGMKKYDKYLDEKSHGALKYIAEMPVNIITVNDQPFKTKNECNIYFRASGESKSRILTYNHVCYGVDIQPDKDCFGYNNKNFPGFGELEIR